MSHYSKGRQFEYRCIKELRGQGWTCFRQAGSHTPADIIAMKAGEIRLVQCQTDPYFAPAKKQALIELARENNCQAWLAYRENRKVVWEQIKKNKQEEIDWGVT